MIRGAIIILLSVPLVSLDCVCHPISLCESSPEYVYVHYCMFIVLYCNVCTLYTVCSGVVCGNSIVICCIVLAELNMHLHPLNVVHIS